MNHNYTIVICQSENMIVIGLDVLSQWIASDFSVTNWTTDSKRVEDGQ